MGGGKERTCRSSSQQRSWTEGSSHGCEVHGKSVPSAVLYVQYMGGGNARRTHLSFLAAGRQHWRGQRTHLSFLAWAVPTWHGIWLEKVPVTREVPSGDAFRSPQTFEHDK